MTPIRARVGDPNLARAERALVSAATGPAAESPLAFNADEVRGQAYLWGSVLDPDGTLPAEERAMQARRTCPGLHRR